MGYGLSVLGCGLSVVGCGLWVVGCGLWVVCCPMTDVRPDSIGIASCEWFVQKLNSQKEPRKLSR